MVIPVSSFLTHMADSVRLATGVNESGDVILGPEIRHVRCYHESRSMTWQMKSTGEVVEIKALFIFDNTMPEIPPRSEIIFDGKKYSVVSCEGFRAYGPYIHHWEVLCA